MKPKLNTKPMESSKKAALICLGLGIVGATIAILSKYRVPRGQIRHYKTNGRVQKPRKHYRCLRKRSKKINNAIKTEKQ